MILVAYLVDEITNVIKQKEGKLDYDKWHVAFSWKDLKQFKFDTQIYMENVTEIGKIGNTSIEELTEALDVMGIDYKIEQEPTTIYLYKTLF